MRALFGDATVENYGDFVGCADGGESVSDNESCSAAAELVKSLLDHDLGGIVEGACCLVEDKYAWVLQENSRDAEALLLTAGKLDSALADLGIITLFEGHDVIVNVCSVLD